MIAAPTLLHCTVGQACHQVVHFALGADMVGFVDNCLLFIFGHSRISIHRRLIYSQRHTKPNRYFVEIHPVSSFPRPPCVKGAGFCEAKDWGIAVYRHLTIPPSRLRRATSLCTREALCCGVQHIFDEDAVAGGRIVHKDMGNSADKLSVLDDGTAGHG